MKKWIVLTVLALVCVFAHGVLAQPYGSGNAESSYRSITDFRLTTGLDWCDRFMQDDNRGTYRSYSGNLSISSGHYTLVSYQVTSNDYRGVDLSGLEANRSTVSFGGTVPVSRKFKIRTVHNSWGTYDTDETIQAAGAYLDLSLPRQWRFEYGMETFFRQAPELYYLMLERKFGYQSTTMSHVMPATDAPLPSYVYSGYSKHYVQEPGEEHHFNDRIMLSGSIPIGPVRLGMGISHRTDSLTWSSATRAWSIAFGIPSSGDSTSLSPTLYAKFSYKPRSKHLHLMGSFWGNYMPDIVMNMMFRFNFRSLLSPTRVVHNQNFYIRAQNIHTQEHGRIGWYAVYFEFNPTNYLTSKSFKGAVYYTHTNWKKQPFIGYIYSHQEDVTYNFIAHKLESPGHQQHIIDAGLRIGNSRLSTNIALGKTSLEGGSLSATMWF